MNGHLTNSATNFPKELQSAQALLDAQAQRFKAQYAQYLSLAHIQRVLVGQVKEEKESPNTSSTSHEEEKQKPLRLPQEVYEELSAAFDREPNISKETIPSTAATVAANVGQKCNYPLTAEHVITYFNNRIIKAKQIKAAQMTSQGTELKPAPKTTPQGDSTLKDLVTIMNNQGGISGVDSMQKLLELMKTNVHFSNVPILCQVLQRTVDQDALAYLVDHDGIVTVNEWLCQFRETKNTNSSPLLEVLLKALVRIPVTVAAMRTTGVGKTMSKLTKHDSKTVSDLALHLRDKWKQLASVEQEKAKASEQSKADDKALKRKATSQIGPDSKKPANPPAPVAMDDSALFGAKKSATIYEGEN